MCSNPSIKKVFLRRALVRGAVTSGGQPVAGASTERLNLSVGQQAQLDYALNAIEEVVVMGSAVETAATAIGPTAVFGVEDLQKSPAINRNINDVIQQDPRIYVDQSSSADSIQCNGTNPRFNSLSVGDLQRATCTTRQTQQTFSNKG